MPPVSPAQGSRSAPPAASFKLLEANLTLHLAGYFPSNLVLTTKIAVPAPRRGNARAGGSGGGKGWQGDAEKLLVDRGEHGAGQASPVPLAAAEGTSCPHSGVRFSR